MLSPGQIQARDGKLTASRVACLMTGDKTEILNLWQMMVGDPNYQEPDLSGVWPVQLGICTEQLSLDWYERKTGHAVTRRGEVVIHPDCEWAACTLDGFDADIPAPVEAKHVGGREPLARIIERYQPQVHWSMTVTQTQTCVLSVIEGANEPIREQIGFDDAYGKELWARANAFMRCVETLTPPCEIEPVKAPVIPVKIYDMSNLNSWAMLAGEWLANIGGKKTADKAEKELKALMPSDGARAHGHGVVIARDRAGRLSVREHRA